MRPAWVPVTVLAPSALLLSITATATAFVAHHGPANLVSSRSAPAVNLAVSRPNFRRAFRQDTSANARRLGRASDRGGASTGRLSMAFDLGQMMEQIMGSIGGNGGSSSNGGGDSSKGVVYDAAIVGYGPAGGVMVRLVVSCLVFVYIKSTAALTAAQQLLCCLVVSSCRVHLLFVGLLCCAGRVR